MYRICTIRIRICVRSRGHARVVPGGNMLRNIRNMLRDMYRICAIGILYICTSVWNMYICTIGICIYVRSRGICVYV